MLKLALAGALALACVTLTQARDNGQWEGVDPKTREWFRSVRSPSGILCCDTADGHRTTWRPDNNGGYEVLIEGQWLTVPPEAVVRESGNPLGEAVVWYVPVPVGGELPRIRCFVPGVEG
jgi:hypothetical protein